MLKTIVYIVFHTPDMTGWFTIEKRHLFILGGTIGRDWNMICFILPPVVTQHQWQAKNHVLGTHSQALYDAEGNGEFSENISLFVM